MHEEHEVPEMGPALQEPEVTNDKTPGPEVVNGALEQMTNEDSEEEARQQEIERIIRGTLN